MHWINLSASATLSGGEVTRFLAMFVLVVHEHGEGGEGCLVDWALISGKRGDHWAEMGVLLGGRHVPQFCF